MREQNRKGKAMLEGRSLVTGGAGFIGGHLTERLLKEGCKVTVLDNFSNGKIENIQHLLHEPSLVLVEEDLKRPRRLRQIARSCNTIFHLAANPEVRLGEVDPKIHFEENVLATFNLLEAVRRGGTPKTIVFTSTSTVYGEAEQIPTPEDYGPLLPISTYGASKLACEAMIISYAYTFNHRALILRLANIVGPRSNHGVIADFVKKVKANRKKLEILGDGTQVKSYMHVADCIEAMIHLTKTFQKDTRTVDVFNVGSDDSVAVACIAKIVAEEMDASSIEYEFTGGVDGGRGWRGDVKTMQLSIEKLLQTAWRPKYSSKQAVKLAARALVKQQLDMASTCSS